MTGLAHGARMVLASLAAVASVAALGAPAAPAATAPASRDTYGADGVVYRLVPGQGYRFHPLANFARLNVLVSRGRVVEARRLARALLWRAVRRQDALYWEYDFAFGGPTRWTSGFAQAVAAQALARAWELAGDAPFLDAAHAAFNALLRSHLRPLGGGAWILEYGFSDMAVLNAQLQTLVSLDDYGTFTDWLHVHDAIAAIDRASRTLLRRFDTGCWSRYALGGVEADLHYHAYHVELLRRLAVTRGDPIWSQTAARWDRYLRHRHRPCSDR